MHQWLVIRPQNSTLQIGDRGDEIVDTGGGAHGCAGSGCHGSCAGGNDHVEAAAREGGCTLDLWSNCDNIGAVCKTDINSAATSWLIKTLDVLSVFSLNPKEIKVRAGQAYV